MSLERTAIAILAGGYGTRLWPLSTRERPKQFAPILPEGSVLQETYGRARRIAQPDQILIVGNREHADLYRTQLPELPVENLILEPAASNTAPAVGLTAALESSRDRFEVVVSIPVDHFVTNAGEWETAVAEAATYARHNDEIVSIAAVPSHPEVKFGYLVVGDRGGGSDRHPISRVRRFVEKPDRETLAEMMAEGTCLRNMGMIAFRPGIMLDELALHVPAIAEPLSEACAMGMTESSIDAAYASMPKVSIDAALLQSSERLVAIASAIESVDTGDFATLGQVLDSDKDGNRIRGRVVSIDSTGNTVVADEATVAVVGVRDLVIIVDNDTVLVCPKDSTQRIREAAK